MRRITHGEKENSKRLKKLDDIDAKYSKKIASAKKKEEKELLEFEWLDAIDEIEKTPLSFDIHKDRDKDK